MKIKTLFLSLLTTVTISIPGQSMSVEPSTVVTTAIVFRTLFSKPSPNVALEVGLANRDILIEMQGRLTLIENGIGSILKLVSDLPNEMREAELENFNFELGMTSIGAIKGFIQDYQSYLVYVDSGRLFVDDDMTRDQWLKDRAEFRAVSVQTSLNIFESQPERFALNTWSILVSAFGETAIRAEVVDRLASDFQKIQLSTRLPYIVDQLESVLNPTISGSLTSLKNRISQQLLEVAWLNIKTHKLESGLEQIDLPFGAEGLVSCLERRKNCTHFVCLKEQLEVAPKHPDLQRPHTDGCAQYGYKHHFDADDPEYAYVRILPMGPEKYAPVQSQLTKSSVRPANLSSTFICDSVKGTNKTFEEITKSAERVDRVTLLVNTFVQLESASEEVENAIERFKLMQKGDLTQISLTSVPSMTGREISSITKSIFELSVRDRTEDTQDYELSARLGRERIADLLTNQNMHLQTIFDEAASAANTNRMWDLLVGAAEFYKVAAEWNPKSMKAPSKIQPEDQPDGQLKAKSEAPQLFAFGSILGKELEKAGLTELSGSVQSKTVDIGDYVFEKQLESISLARSYLIPEGETRTLNVYVRQSTRDFSPVLVEPKLTDVIPLDYKFERSIVLKGRYPR